MIYVYSGIKLTTRAMNVKFILKNVAKTKKNEQNVLKVRIWMNTLKIITSNFSFM